MNHEEVVQVEWEPIEISTAGTLTASELAPFLDEVHKFNKFVRLNLPAPGNEPPAADFTEIAITYGIPAALYLGTKYVEGFFNEWGSAHAKALREAAVTLFRRGTRSRHPESDREFVPCQFSIGRARFLIGEPVDEKELAEAMLRIPPYFEELQRQGFDFDSPAYPHRIWWNREKGEWGD